MNCEETEEIYPTAYDGIDAFQCLIRKCDNQKEILRCFGNWTHTYPLMDDVDNYIHAKIAFEFMKNHPRIH